MYSRQILTNESTLHGLVGTHTQKDSVEIIEKILSVNINTYLRVQPEFDAHSLEHFSTAFHDLFFQLKLGDTEG